MEHNEKVLRAAVEEAYREARACLDSGQLPTYIPELATVDPSKLAIALCTVTGESFAAGDVEQSFTFQSLSKVFTLSAVLARSGDGFLDRMSCEPSGDAFHSIVRLEEESGHPRNPYINAGAILVSEQMPGDSPDEKIAGFLRFLGTLSEGARFELDDDVYRSEFATGNRNRALAHFMKHYGMIQDPPVAVDTYFRQCSIRIDAGILARIGLFLANGGEDPISRGRVLDARQNRTVVALMATCGLYDEVGRFAIRVGLPAKSGVSGGILAVVPGKMTIAVYSPKLGPRGNSVAGMAALTTLSRRLDLSVFG